MSPMNTTHSDDQKGGILLMFTALLLGLMVIGAVAIELNSLYAARTSIDEFGKLTALGAIQGYYETQLTGDNMVIERKERARARAEQVFRKQFSYHLSEDLLHNFKVVSMTSVPDTPPEGQLAIIAGDWKRGTDGQPTFDPQPNLDEPVNAFRIIGNIPLGSKSPFSFLLGSPLPSLYIDFTSAAVPRRGCVLVDISDSTIRDTHIFKSPAQQISSPETGFGSSFAFLPTQSIVDAETGTSAVYNPGVTYSIYEPMLAPLRSNYTTRPGTITVTPEVFATQHYWDDYKLVTMYQDADYGGVCSSFPDGKCPHPDNSLFGSGDPEALPVDLSIGDRNLSYYIDKFPNSGLPVNDYNGPQPLSDIFRSLNAFVKIFKDRAVGGDRLCMIFYDDSMFWSRVLKPSNEWDYLLSITDIDDKSSGAWEKIMKLGLFPGAIPTHKINLGGLWELPQSDTANALRLAETLLAHDQSDVVTADFIVMIGDGLTNCYTDWTNTRQCLPDYEYHVNGIAEMREFVVERYLPRGVPLHVVLMGDSVGPHTLAIEDATQSGGACMDDEQARTSGQDFVRGLDESEREDAFNHKSKDNPYFQINEDLYELAAVTGGIWAPIRPKAPSCPTTINCAGLTDKDDQRILFDGDCRSTKEQITDYLSRIVENNPFVVVDTN